MRKTLLMKEARLSRSFSLKTAGGGVQDLEKESFHMMRISLKDALVLNEEVALTEERRSVLKCIRRAEEG